MAALCRSLFWKEAFKSSPPKYVQRCLPRLCSALAREKESASSPEIIIPTYIPRGPTDILRALASTVQRDPTAAHYTYHDDPYLIPTTPGNKRSFALSKESGKRAARYFLENFPENFENDEAEPKIPVFNAPLKLTELSEVSVETLNELIHNLDVPNALLAYSNLKKENVKIEHETLCELLELLCYYNSSELTDETFKDERWFKFNEGRRETKVMWQNDGPADMLFEEIELKDARAYQAIIQGTARFCHPTKALKLYAEMKEKGFVGSTRMYNCLIQLILLISPTTDVRWAKAEEFLQAMVQEEVQPDVITFNSLLHLLTYMPGFKANSKKKASSILAEMKALDITPSLATYAHILNIYYRRSAPICYILDDIMNTVESKEWELRDAYDLTFFPTAMYAATKYLHDLDLAHRIYLAVRTGDNRKFLENESREGMFYTNYFTLLCSIQGPDKFIPIYEKVVPNDYIPESSVFEEIILAVKNSKQLHYLPKLWSDVLMFRMDNRDAVVRAALSTAAEGGKQDDQVLQEQLTAVASSVLERIKTQSLFSNRKMTVQCTGDLFGDLLTCFLNGDNLDKAWEVVLYVTKNKSTIIGFPPAKPLLAFCSAALDVGAIQKALTCLGYACDADIPEAATFLRENASKIPRDFVNRYTVLDRIDE